MENAGIYHHYSPFTLGDRSGTLCLEAVVPILSRLVSRRKLVSGQSIVASLGLTRTALFGALIDGPDHLIGRLQKDLVELGLADYEATMLRWNVAEMIAVLLEPYNNITRPAAAGYVSGEGFFVVEPFEAWLLAKAGVDLAKRTQFTALWMQHDSGLLAAVRNALPELVEQGGSSVSPAVLAGLEEVLDQIEAFFVRIESVKLPDLSALTPAPDDDDLAARPDIPSELLPQVASAARDTYRTYPRFEFIARGGLVLELEDDPLRLECSAGKIRIELRVRSIRLADAPAALKVVYFVAAEGVIVRLHTGFLDIGSDEFDLQKLNVSVSLEPTIELGDATSLASVRLTTSGMTWEPSAPLVDFSLSLELPSLARVIHAIAQSIDALVIPGNAIPSRAQLEESLEVALSQKIRKILADRLGSELEKFVAGANDAIMPRGRPLLRSIRWEPLPEARVVETVHEYKCTTADGISITRWFADFAAELSLELPPLLHRRGNLLRKDGGSTALAVRLDYVRVKLAQVLRRAVIATFAPGSPPSSITDWPLPRVTLRPAISGEIEPSPSALRFMIDDWSLPLDRAGMTRVHASTWLAPDLATSREQQLHKSLGESVTDLRGWIDAKGSIEPDPLRQLFNEVPFAPCIRLNVPGEGPFEQAISLQVSTGSEQQARLLAAFRAVFPFPFAVGVLDESRMPVRYDEWATSKEWISFMWLP